MRVFGVFLRVLNIVIIYSIHIYTPITSNRSTDNTPRPHYSCSSYSPASTPAKTPAPPTQTNTPPTPKRTPSRSPQTSPTCSHSSLAPPSHPSPYTFLVGGRTIVVLVVIYRCNYDVRLRVLVYGVVVAATGLLHNELLFELGDFTCVVHVEHDNG